MSCVGCGLIDEISQIRIATSGQFGGPGLAYGLDDTAGAPIYCDEDGKIRAVPPHGSVTVVDTGSGSSLNHDLNPAGTTSATENAAGITLANPSTVRPASVILHMVTKYNVYVSLFGTAGLALKSTLTIDGVTYVFARGIAYADTIPANPDLDDPGGAVPYSIEEYISESYAFTLAPGDSIAVTLEQTVDVAGRTALCNFDGFAAALRALVVTR